MALPRPTSTDPGPPGTKGRPASVRSGISTSLSSANRTGTSSTPLSAPPSSAWHGRCRQPSATAPGSNQDPAPSTTRWQAGDAASSALSPDRASFAFSIAHAAWDAVSGGAEGSKYCAEWRVLRSRSNVGLANAGPVRGRRAHRYLLAAGHLPRGRPAGPRSQPDGPDHPDLQRRQISSPSWTPGSARASTRCSPAARPLDQPGPRAAGPAPFGLRVLAVTSMKRRPWPGRLTGLGRAEPRR